MWGKSKLSIQACISFKLITPKLTNNMKKYTCILILLLTITTTLSAQIVYDTIPDMYNEDDIVFGGLYCEKAFIFKDLKTQTLNYLKTIDLNDIDCKDKRVIVSTVFGRNGKLKNTKIVKSGGPVCDSIAFYYVDGFKDWLPGLMRSRFVDISYIFPFYFDNEFKSRLTNMADYFTASADEYSLRETYFNFINSDSSHKIINDFTFFNKYLADKLSNDDTYVYNWEYDRPANKNCIKIVLNNDIKDSISFIIYHPDRPSVLYYIPAKERGIIYWDNWEIKPNFSPAKKNGILYLEKDIRTTLIGFIEGKEEPKLAIYKDIIFSRDTVINLDLKVYKKKSIDAFFEKSNIK